MNKHYQEWLKKVKDKYKIDKLELTNSRNYKAETLQDVWEREQKANEKLYQESFAGVVDYRGKVFRPCLQNELSLKKIEHFAPAEV